MDSDDLFTDNGLDFILNSLRDNPKVDAFLYGVKTIKKHLLKKFTSKWYD